MVGVAVNVTLVPAHIAPEGLAAMLTLATKIGLTSIIIEFEVAGLPDKQGLALDVNIQVIIFPAVKEDELYVELVSPGISEPLSCH